MFDNQNCPFKLTKEIKRNYDKQFSDSKQEAKFVKMAQRIWVYQNLKSDLSIHSKS